MLTEVRDRNSILSGALAIASAEEREAYIARACGDDAALRQQVEEGVAAHFHAAGSAQPEVAAAAGALPHGQGRTQNGTNLGDTRAPAGARAHDGQREVVEVSMETKNMEHNNPRGLVTVGTLLGMLAIAGGSTGLTVWAMKAGGPAKEAVAKAQAETSEAKKAEDEAKHQRDEALEEAKKAAKERDEARAAQKEVQKSELTDKEVLLFLRTNVLAPRNLTYWIKDGKRKDVKLKQAVDAAEARIANAYRDRPLVEATIRQILGLTYLDLGDAKKAVSQLHRAWVLLRVELGTDNTTTLECKNNLARALREAGQPDKAGSLFEQIPNSKGRQTPRGQKPVRG